MASSLLTGDRRWAPARKSGMTVLGKVPKPINLPSQRLENHGLDPNVEIVPKGTHTWGVSRQSSAAPNAWGSSNLSSPNTDGSAGSPSHVSGRPSSGGSGTRPSTAGSDRSHEPNAWGPNLRPSSASGILASNQISQTAGRPRSAETRPGSSQLSRFAENAVDTPVAWGATGTVERLGSFSSKTNSFTLSSGDFPTLGSEKSSESQSQRGHSSQGRPASSSGTVSGKKETLGPELAGNKNSSVQGNVDTWRAENYPSVVHGTPPNVENWQKDPHQGQSYPGADVPPHQFESWHNAPFHPSNWYRGGAAGGPYRPPGPPGNYPVEPYYPHVPARPLPNVQAFPRPEAGPAGYHPKNGDSYHCHMPPEAYMVPSHSAIPIRPGVFQGPVPYEGYYGPPHGSFSSSIDREVPVMGMAARPGVYNQYPTQNVNVDHGHFHARPGGYSPVMNKEQVKSDNAHETQGQYRVLLKQHDSWEDHGQREKGEQAVISGSPHTERGNQPVSTRDGDWRTNSRRHEPASLQPVSGRESYSSDTIVRNSSQDSNNVTGDNLMRKSVSGTVQIRNIQQYPVTKKNATLMEKVEGLNTKARITDCHSETGIVSSKGKTKNFKDVSSSADHFGKVICADAAPTEIALTIGVAKPIPCEVIASTSEGSEVLSIDQNISSGPSESQALVLSKSKTVEAGENTHFQHQKRSPSTRGVDHPAKLRPSRHDNDEWMKKSTARDSSENNIVKNGESKTGTSVSVYHPSQEAIDRQELHVAGIVSGGSYSASSFDSVDQKAQRAKTKEIAIQRAKQLQKEEEERTREQKAKALAKLEELNRRSLAESSNLKSNIVVTPSNDALNKSEADPSAVSLADAGSAPVADATLSEAPSSTLARDSEAASKKSDDGQKNVGESAELSSYETTQASHSATQTSIVPQNQFMSMGQDKKTTEITEKTTDIHDIAGSKQKQMGYRRRQNTPQEKHLDEKQATSENTGSPKYVGKVASNASSDTLPNSEDPSVQHRKKNNRGTRNRNKPDESMSSPSRSSTQNESTSEKCVTEVGNTKPSETLAVAVSVLDESLNETGGTQVSKNGVAAPSVTSSNQGLSDSIEDIHGKASNHWKPHPHRKSNRGQQAHKPVTKHHGTEAVIWAPVRTANKNEPSEKVNETSTTETTNPPPGKDGHDVHIGVKAKRAEMERYVVKPVAKELSQQGNSQQTSSLGQTASDDSGVPEPVSPRVGSGKSDALTVGKASFASDTKNGEGSKHNKYGRTQASWRQRGSTESLSQNLVEGSFDTRKVVQRGSDQIQPSKIDSLQARQSDDDWNGNNDSAIPGESETIAGAKNEGTSKQRRHPYKAHRVAGGNYAPSDNKNIQRGMANRIDPQPPVLSLKSENQNSSGEQIKSHWQPKSQTHTHYGRQGNRSSGGQRAASQVEYSDKELPLQGPVNNYIQNEDNSAPSQETVGVEARDADAAKRERKAIPDLSKEQTSSFNQDFPSTGESGRANFDPQQAQSHPSDVHRRGQYNGRFQRGSDMPYRGRDSGQDAGRQTLQVNGDKRKNNQNLEYQRVGSYHKPSESFQQNPNASEEAHEHPRAPGSRYREKGHHNPRGGGGGHFYGRSGGCSCCRLP